MNMNSYDRGDKDDLIARHLARILANSLYHQWPEDVTNRARKLRSERDVVACTREDFKLRSERDVVACTREDFKEQEN